MKRLIEILFLSFLAVNLYAQERTTNEIWFQKDDTYLKYTGINADTLMYTTQDTIDIPVFLNKDYPVQFYANFNVDTIGDNDFKLQVKVLGKVFEDESWSAITNDTSEDITANGTDFAIYSQSGPSYVFAKDSTITQTYNAHYYRYLLFRLILTDTSTPGDGFKLNDMELKIWERKY